MYVWIDVCVCLCVSVSPLLCAGGLDREAVWIYNLYNLYVELDVQVAGFLYLEAYCLIEPDWGLYFSVAGASSVGMQGFSDPQQTSSTCMLAWVWV